MTLSLSSTSRRLWVAATASWLLLLLLTWNARPFALRDHVFQFKALEQYLAGESPSLNHLVQPEPGDLSRDHADFLIWWAPGGQLALYPLRQLGLSPGAALRVLALGGILLGAAGWALWYACFDLPRWVAFAVALLFPWLRFASSNLFVYSAEILLFAPVPWLLLLAWRRQGKVGLGGWLALGAGFGSLYALKYTGAFIGLGCLGAIVWTERAAWRMRSRCWLAFAAGYSAPILLLTAINRHYGAAANIVTQSLQWNFSPSSIFYILANPGLMMADLQSLLSWLLQHPTHGLPHGFELVATAGFVLAVVWIGLLATDECRPVERFAALILIIASAALLVVWTFSWGASHEPRHVANPSLALAPAVLAVGWRRLRRATTPWWQRTVCLGAFGLAWIAPLLYGPTTVIGKTLTLPSTSTTATGLRDPTFPAAGQAVAIAFLRAQAKDGGVWLLGYGNTTFEIPGRHLLRYFFNADSPEAYAAVNFATSRPIRVHLLIEDALEPDHRGPNLRAQFTGAGSWTRAAVPGSAVSVWTADLRPTVR